MRKRIVAILIISIVSSLTALVLSRAIKIFFSDNNVSKVRIPVATKIDTVYSKKAIPIMAHKINSKKDSIKNVTLKKDDQALREIIEAENDLQSLKSEHSIQKDSQKLNKFYSDKKLNPGTLRQLKESIEKIRIHLKKMQKSESAIKADTVKSKKVDSITYK